MTGLRHASLLTALVCALASCRGGCGRQAPEGPPVCARDPLQLFPPEALTVVTVDLAKLGAAPIFADKTGGKATPPFLASMRKAFDGVRNAYAPGTESDFDLDAIVFGARAGAGMPATGVIACGRRLDMNRAMEQLSRNAGGMVISSKRGRRTLWSAQWIPQVAWSFLDDRTFLLGTGGWTERVVDLIDGTGSAPTAASSAVLARAMQDVSGHAVAGVSLEPYWIQRMIEGLGLEPPADARRATLTVDAGQRLTGALNVDLASAADAQALADKVQSQWNDLVDLKQLRAKGHPSPKEAQVIERVQQHAPKLRSAVRARAQGTGVRVDLDLDEESMQTMSFAADNLPD